MASKSTMTPETDQQRGEVLQRQPEGTSQKGGKKKQLQFAIRAGVTLLLFVFLLKSVSWSMLVATLTHASHASLLMGLALGALCIVFSSYGWHSLVLAEHIRTDLARLINLYLVGMAFSHFLPTSMGGDVAKAFYVGRDSGNVAGATSAVLLSRITGFVGMLLIALPALLIWRSSFPSNVIVGFLLLSLLLLVLIGGVIAFSTRLPEMSQRFLRGKWLTHRVMVMIIEIGQTLRLAARRPHALGTAILFAMLFWIASYLNYYGYAMALHMQVPLSFYVLAISFSSLVAFFPISINGFGVRESTLVYVFSTIHVPATTSLLLAFLMDIQVLFFGVIGGCIYLAMHNKGKH